MSVEIERSQDAAANKKNRTWTQAAVELLEIRDYTARIVQTGTRRKELSVIAVTVDGKEKLVALTPMKLFLWVKEHYLGNAAVVPGSGRFGTLAEMTVRLPAAHGSSNSLQTAPAGGSYAAKHVVNGNTMVLTGSLADLGPVGQYRKVLEAAGLEIRHVPGGWIAQSPVTKPVYDQIVGQKIADVAKAVVVEQSTSAPKESAVVPKTLGQKVAEVVRKVVRPKAVEAKEPTTSASKAVKVKLQYSSYRGAMFVTVLRENGNIDEPVKSKTLAGRTMTQARYWMKDHGWVPEGARCRTAEEGLVFVRAS